MQKSALFQRLLKAQAQLNQVVVGKEQEVRLILCCLLAEGHVLLEDVPGVGKTTMARALAATLGLQFSRIQFTADLLPADVVGFSMPVDGKFRFQPGPIFAQLVLADEINRASPKSQSALLEAMEERQVSVDGETHPLSAPFFVVATENPQEQIGTNPLPESQLDRFLMCLSLGYPDAQTEIALLQGHSGRQALANCEALLSATDILSLQALVHAIPVSQALAEYVRKLLEATRAQGEFQQGLSTRAGLGLIQAARAYAFLAQSELLLPQHVQAVFPSIARHRLQSDYASQAMQLEALDSLLHKVPVPL